MKFTKVISKFKTEPEIVNVGSVETLSYSGIETITVNETEYGEVFRVCLMNKDSKVRMYVSQFQAKKVTGIDIEDIEDLEVC